MRESVYKKEKKAAIYQQTFWGQSGNSWTFRFSRIYKSRPENKLILRVLQSALGGSTKYDVPHIITMTNAAEINGKCNQFVYNTFGNTTTQNPFVLGLVGSAAHPTCNTGSPEVMLNDLPLNDMTISVQHLDLTPTGNLYLSIVFEIEEIEEV
jgi:hypothetical protein